MAQEVLEPNYEAWCKIDEWTFKDAALLLSGLNPLDYRSVKFNLKEKPKPPELNDPYLIFMSLKNFNGGKAKYLTGTTPREVIHIAQAKKLPVPDKLLQCFETQMKLEDEQSLQTSTISEIEPKNQADKNLAVRERDNLLKAIGLFIGILADEPKYTKKIIINNRINALQVTQILIDKAEELKINTQGIKSLNRKIKAAIELIAEEREY